MAGEFWLDDHQWAVIAPLLPTNRKPPVRTAAASDRQRG